MEQHIIHYFKAGERTDWHDRYYFNKALQQFRPLLYTLVNRYIAKNRRYEYMVYAEVALFEALEAYDEQKGTLVTCIYTHGKYALLNELKKDQHFLGRQLTVDDTALTILCERGTQLHDVSDYFDEHIVQKVTRAELQLLIALYIDGYSYDELSEQTGIAVETLKKRRQRLVARLRAARRV